MIGVTCPRCKQSWFCDETDVHRALLCPACSGGRVSHKPSDFASATGAFFRSLPGWFLVVFGTTLFGVWFGMCLRFGRLFSLGDAYLALSVSSLGLFFYAPVLGAFAVSALVWFLPFRIESTRLRIGAAVANFVTWFALVFWLIGFQR